ncbi:MAG: hypothetical protein Q9170_006546 [Blastenia crenularia]
MKASYFTTLCLCGLASNVVAVVKRTTVKSSIVEAKYDDANLAVLPEVAPVGVYQGLAYSAWSFLNLASPTSGSAPHSPPNAIATTLVAGQALGGTPTLTVAYTGTISIAFDLLSFFFGCLTPTGQGAVQVAEQCTILVAGFDASNKEVATATYTFTPPATNLVKPPMIQAVLPSSFKGLHNATLIQSSPATQVLVVDNTRYNLFTSS